MGDDPRLQLVDAGNTTSPESRPTPVLLHLQLRARLEKSVDLARPPSTFFTPFDHKWLPKVFPPPATNKPKIAE